MTKTVSSPGMEFFRIGKKKSETHDTFTLDLYPGPATHQWEFQPGQFNMLYLFGVGEVPISISGNPAKALPIIHTIRSVGAVTDVMERMQKGERIGVRGPFGTGWPVELAEGADVLIIAGGIGLAPLRPAIYRLIAHRERYGNVTILYGARTPEDLLYENELQRWRGRFDMNVFITVDSAKSGWRGNVGVVTTLIRKLTIDPDETLAFICGPEVMMRYTIFELQRHNVPLSNVFISMERNMKCAVGSCGHCQIGPYFVCKDGPVFPFTKIEPYFTMREK